MDLHPEWVVGFTDGEGCFHVSVQKNRSLEVGYQVLPEFVVVQHERDKPVLYALKRFFRAGVVRRNHEDRWAYRVRSMEGLKQVCEFFMAHPLKTQKNVAFRKFRRIVLMMERGEHLTREGLLEIIAIAKAMNTAKRPALERVEAELRRRRDGPHPTETSGGM